MVDQPRYRVWHQTIAADGINEPEHGSWLSRDQALKLRHAYFNRADVARTWIEKEGVPARMVGETPFDRGAPLPAPEPVPEPAFIEPSFPIVLPDADVSFAEITKQARKPRTKKKKKRKPKSRATKR